MEGRKGREEVKPSARGQVARSPLDPPTSVPLPVYATSVPLRPLLPSFLAIIPSPHFQT